MAKPSSTKENLQRSGLSTGLDVLELLSARRLLSLTEIADALGRSKSGVHSVLGTLAERGYVQRVADGAYRLGVRAWELGRTTPQMELAQIAEPMLNRLAEETEESVILGALAGFDVVYLTIVQGRQPVRLHVEVGERIPANCTTTGVALLATLPDDEIEALLPERLVASTPLTIVDHEGLWAEIARTRARGYARMRGTWNLDVAGVAAAVDESGRSRAAVCVSAPLYRVTDAWYAQVVPAMLETVATIAATLVPTGDVGGFDARAVRRA